LNLTWRARLDRLANHIEFDQAEADFASRQAETLAANNGSGSKPLK
jgi:hypothetical protein